MIKHKLIILPSENESFIVKNDKEQLIVFTTKRGKIGDETPHNFYVISEKAMMDGGDIINHYDFYYSKGDNKVFQYLPEDDKRDTSPDFIGTYKVFATSDKSLLMNKSDLSTIVPQLPSGVISSICFFYNKNLTINTIILEHKHCETYLLNECNSRFACCNEISRVKVDDDFEVNVLRTELSKISDLVQVLTFDEYKAVKSTNTKLSDND
jgi:hypothetical protein